MPLIPQQAIVSYRSGLVGEAPALIKGLMKELEKFPPCRIVSITTLKGSSVGSEIIAVIETV